MQSSRANLWKPVAITLAVLAAGAAVFVGVRNDDDQTQTEAQSTSVQDLAAGKKALYGLNGLVRFNPVGFDNGDFCKAIDSIHPDFMREPGGTNANYFNWRTDVPSLPSIKNLVEKTHCQILWDLNVLTSTVDDQIAMLDAAYKLGIFKDSLWFEMGNELNQFNYEGKQRFPNAAAYADSCRHWVGAIKKHFSFVPFIQYGCVGENKKWKGSETWAKNTLEKNPDCHLIWHYYNPGKFTHNGRADTNAIKKMMHDDFVKSFGDVPPSRVWVTEFSLNDHKKDTPDMLDTLTDDQVEVAVQFMFKEFTDMGIPVIIKHNVVGKAYAAVKATKSGAYLLPAGIGMREFLLSVRK